MNAALPPIAAVSLPPRFACGLADHGAAVALVTASGEISYADLAGRAARFARRLGGGRKLLALEAAASVEFVAAYLGALGAGHAVALMADAAEAARFCDRFCPDAVYLRRNGRWHLTIDTREKPPLHPDLALVMMTSGSTGHGKAVRLSARAVDENARAIADFQCLTPGERAALVLPLHYSYGLSVLNSHLAVGASIWLAEGGLMADDFLGSLRAVRATSLAAVPHGHDVLARLGFDTADLPDLRLLTSAGGAMPVARMRALGALMAARGGRFLAMYGQTEATARIAYIPPEAAATVDRHGVIGVPVPGGRLSLHEGELLYDGPGVMMGYAESRADLARGAEVGPLATGDLAEVGPDGMFRIIGRARRMSKIAGLRIAHDAVEAGLAERRIVAAVWGDDTRLSVVVETAGGKAGVMPDVAALVAGLTGLTARHISLRYVAALPRRPSGKVDYPQLASGVSVATDGVAQTFTQVFHPVRVAPTDSFASLGGDSLRHVELAMVLESRLGHLPKGWEDIPVATLAAMEAAPAPQTASVDTALVMRALAVLAVVVTHETLWPLYGGAAVMVVLIGLMLARFQRPAMAGGRMTHLLRPLIRVLVPYYLIAAAYAVAWGQVPWGSVLLVSNFGIGAPATFDRLPFLYWFVEAFAQMMLVLVAVLTLPPARRLVGRDPFRFGLWFLGAAMALRFAFPLVWDIGGQRIFTLAWVLYLAALGWLTGVAQGRQRHLVLVIAAPVLALVALYGGNWYGAWLKYGTVFAVIGLLLYLPQMRLPSWAVRPLLAVAGASYLIYLTHRFVPNLLLAPMLGEVPAWVFSSLSIGGGVGLGLLAFATQRAVLRLVRKTSFPFLSR